MTSMTSHAPNAWSRQRSAVLALVTMLAISASAVVNAARERVDFNRANDYYAARASGRIDVVEQYHVGPCEQNLAKGKLPKAAAECNFILRIFPNHPRALQLMTKTCQQWKDPRCNLTEVFERAVAINPTAAPTFVLLGIYHHGAGRHAEAIKSFETALQLDPESTNAHYNLALTLIDTKAYDRANSHAQQAYARGAPLPGLRERLKKAGYWKETSGQTTAAQTKPVEPGKSMPPVAGDAVGKQ